MSYFRPGGRNKTHFVRPMVELQGDDGFKTSRMLMRWGAKNSLMNDFHVKRPHRHGRWRFHEHQWVQRKRWIREYWSRRWKAECRNTAHMALWWKFRVNAREDHDKEQYENYLAQREEKRLREMAKEKQYQPWNLDSCLQDQDYVHYNKTKTEIEHINSMKPEAFLENLRGNFLEKKRQSVQGYLKWKNKGNRHVMARSEEKRVRNAQNIKLQGVDDVKGFDWITFNENAKSMALTDHDPEYHHKFRLIEQNNSDKQLFQEIMNQQNISRKVA